MSEENTQNEGTQEGTPPAEGAGEATPAQPETPAEGAPTPAEGEAPAAPAAPAEGGDAPAEGESNTPAPAEGEGDAAAEGEEGEKKPWIGGHPLPGSAAAKAN